MKLKKDALKIFGFYLFIWYLIPLVFYYFQPEKVLVLFKAVNLGNIIFIFIFLFFFFFNAYLLPKKKLFKLSPVIRIKNNNFFIIIFCAAYLYSSIYFFNRYGLKFRHQGDVSQAGGMIMIMYLCKTFAKIFLFYLLLKAYNKIAITKKERFLLLPILICFLLTIVASTDIIYVALLIVMLLKKEHVFFTPIHKKIKISLKKIVRPLIFLTMIVFVIYIGNANKIGEEAAKEKLVNETTETITDTVLRISTWFLSVIAVGDHYNDNSIALDTYKGIFENMEKRFDILMNYPYQEPHHPWSSKRMNYLLVNRYTNNPKTGSSPGLIASSFYIPFFPLGFFLISAYAVMILRTLSRALKSNTYKLNIFSIAIFTYFVTGVFDSPIDYINIFSPALLYLILFVSACHQIEKEKLKMRPNS